MKSRHPARYRGFTGWDLLRASLTHRLLRLGRPDNPLPLPGLAAQMRMLMVSRLPVLLVARERLRRLLSVAKLAVASLKSGDLGRVSRGLRRWFRRGQ